MIILLEIMKPHLPIDLNFIVFVLFHLLFMHLGELYTWWGYALACAVATKFIYPYYVTCGTK